MDTQKNENWRLSFIKSLHIMKRLNKTESPVFVLLLETQFY